MAKKLFSTSRTAGEARPGPGRTGKGLGRHPAHGGGPGQRPWGGPAPRHASTRPARRSPSRGVDPGAERPADHVQLVFDDEVGRPEPVRRQGRHLGQRPRGRGGCRPLRSRPPCRGRGCDSRPRTANSAWEKPGGVGADGDGGMFDDGASAGWAVCSSTTSSLMPARCPGPRCGPGRGRQRPPASIPTRMRSQAPPVGDHLVGRPAGPTRFPTISSADLGPQASRRRPRHHIPDRSPATLAHPP